jgi:hypothetical protein
MERTRCVLRAAFRDPEVISWPSIYRWSVVLVVGKHVLIARVGERTPKRLSVLSVVITSLAVAPLSLSV